MEFAEHERIIKRLGTKVYLVNPYASWQKEAIEKANGLIRRYIQKKFFFQRLY